jgi:hypothetical protein
MSDHFRSSQTLIGYTVQEWVGPLSLRLSDLRSLRFEEKIGVALREIL